MTVYRHREETLNTHLALVLVQFGLDADAETIQAGGRERPDVLFPWRGLRVVIDGKFADHPKARDAVLADAQGRVQRGVAHIAVAAVAWTSLVGTWCGHKLPWINRRRKSSKPTPARCKSLAPAFQSWIYV